MVVENEKKLKKSEETYRAIFENTGTATVIIREDQTIVLANNKFAELSGFAKNAIEGKKRWTEFVVEEDLDQMMKNHEKRRATNNTAPKSYDFRFKDRDNNIKYIFVSVDMIPGTTQSIASLLDITSRVLAEEKLQAQNRFIDNLIETSALSTWISDDKGTAIRTNSACLRFFGATTDEVVGKYNLFKDAVLIEKGFIPQLKRVFEKGEVADITVDYNFGKIKHISVKNSTHKMIKSIFTPITDKNDKVINVICQTMNLSDLFQAKEALKESEIHYQQLFNLLQYGAEIIDKDGIIIQCNPRSLQMLGYEKDEFIGKHITNFIDEKARVIFKQNFPQLLQGESTSFEIEMIHKDGHKVHVLRSAQPVLNTKREVENILIINIDITERRQIELELEKHRTHLEEMVSKRTKELEEKNRTLDTAIKVFVGRELKIKELQRQISLLTKGNR